jgi:pimeloyl-ACP methyl ester carboxylesterase
MRQILRFDDVAVDLIAEGTGPLVVLLPSAGRDSLDFDDLAASLTNEGYRVLRPQPRGVFGSLGPMTGITLHDLARDVARVIEAEGGGPAFVGGHAFGQWVARMTAADHPHLVRGVMLIAAAAKSIPAELSAGVNKCSDPATPREERLALLQRLFFAPGHDPSGWLEGWHLAARTCQRVASAATKQAEWWGGGSAPILDLQAALDPFKPRDKRDELRDELGGRVTVEVIEDASHALIPEQPAAVVAALVRWMRSVG